jgi:Tex-like protein N-terminal domain
LDSINARIAKELGVQLAQVAAAVVLLGEGSTVPFIARYRKEKTGGLDDTQLRKLEERLGYLTELEDRRAAVIKSITEQGKLTPELQRAIQGADTKVELEISTRRSSRSGGPRPKLRARRDLSRWPIRCLPIQPSIRPKRRKSMSMPRRA